MPKVGIAYSNFLADVNLMKQTCEGHGVFVHEIFTASHVSLAGADHGYYLEVRSEDVEKAGEILNQEGFESFVMN
jgi:hypothetical protein